MRKRIFPHLVWVPIIKNIKIIDRNKLCYFLNKSGETRVIVSVILHLNQLKH